MAISKQKKEELVESYVQQLQDSHALVMTDYRGLTVKQLQALRGQLREQGATLQVVKNTLIKLALQQLGMPVPEDTLQGPTAIAYMADDVAMATKVLFDFAKEAESFTIKGAVLESQILDAEAAKRLRDLPSKSSVLAELLGILQGPHSQLVRTIQAPAGELYRTLRAPFQDLVLTIQAHADKEAGANA